MISPHQYPFRGSDFETSMHFTFLYLAHFPKSLWYLCFSVVTLLGAVLSNYNGLLIGFPSSTLSPLESIRMIQKSDLLLSTPPPGSLATCPPLPILKFPHSCIFHDSPHVLQLAWIPYCSTNKTPINNSHLYFQNPSALDILYFLRFICLFETDRETESTRE